MRRGAVLGRGGGASVRGDVQELRRQHVDDAGVGQGSQRQRVLRNMQAWAALGPGPSRSISGRPIFGCSVFGIFYLVVLFLD